MEQRKGRGGARPGAGRPSAERSAAMAMAVDAVIHCAIAQERIVLWLKRPTYDPTVAELRALALQRVQRAFETEFGAA